MRRNGLKSWIAAMMATAAVPTAAMAQPGRTASVIIRGGAIYDGAATAPVTGDVAIEGDRVVYVGPTRKNPFKSARVIVDARGMVVAPGFIDPHTHSDGLLLAADPQSRLLQPWILQGVTTVFVGNDGNGPSGKPDVGAFFDSLASRPIGPNVAAFVGFGAVRRAVIGDVARGPTAAELSAQKRLVAHGMCQGALGLSTGLFYAPQNFAKTSEVIELAKEAAHRGGVYDTHQRSEGRVGVGLFASLNEVLEIARQTRMPTHISHLKGTAPTTGRASEIVALIDAARKEGLDVTASQYPYNAAYSPLQAPYVPGWALEGGFDAFIERVKDPEIRDRILADVRRWPPAAGTFELIGPGQPWNGRRLDEFARSMGVTPEEAALDMIIASKGKVATIAFTMLESDIRVLMPQPWMMTASDGSAGHPRMYGTFAHKYTEYVVKEKTISLAEFINGSTGRVAEFFRLDRRGRLKAGWYADVVVFDPKAYRSPATYAAPTLPAEGVRMLLINGVAAVQNGKATGQGAGRALRQSPPANLCPSSENAGG